LIKAASGFSIIFFSNIQQGCQAELVEAIRYNKTIRRRTPSCAIRHLANNDISATKPYNLADINNFLADI